MEKIETPIPGVFLLRPAVFRDRRGCFFEAWNKREFCALGITDDFVQDNESHSAYGVVRGLHFQRNPHEQAKLVRVTQGCVLDVVVDIRRGSPAFGRVFSAVLSAENMHELYIPAGMAHGFSVLSDTAVLNYKCAGYYAPEAEGCILAEDEDLGIDWKVEKARRIYSDKDRKGMTFAAYCRSPAFEFPGTAGK